MKDKREEAIGHLRIMHTWAAFALEEGQGFFKRQHYENIRDWTLEAVDALKEHDAVRPEREGSGVTWWNVCGNCRTAINPNDKYCHECGRALKWE